MASNKGGATRSCTTALHYRGARIGNSGKSFGLPKEDRMIFISSITIVKWKYTANPFPVMITGISLCSNSHREFPVMNT